MISGESERADGDPREVLRDHDEFSEDDEIGVPAGLRAAERVDTSGPMRPNGLERSRHTRFRGRRAPRGCNRLAGEFSARRAQFERRETRAPNGRGDGCGGSPSLRCSLFGPFIGARWKVRDEKTKSSSDWQTFYRSAGRGIQANAARTRGDQGVRGVPGSSKALIKAEGHKSSVRRLQYRHRP